MPIQVTKSDTGFRVSFDIDADVLESTVDGKTYQWPIGDMTDQAFAYILRYGAQRSVNDKTGGSDKTADDKAKAARSRIANYADPTWYPGTRDNAADPLEYYRARAFAMTLQAKGKAEKDWFGKKGGFLTDHVDTVNALLAKQSAKVRDAVEASAETALAKVRAEAEARKRERDAIKSEAAEMAEELDIQI